MACVPQVPAGMLPGQVFAMQLPSSDEFTEPDSPVGISALLLPLKPLRLLQWMVAGVLEEEEQREKGEHTGELKRLFPSLFR